MIFLTLVGCLVFSQAVSVRAQTASKDANPVKNKQFETGCIFADAAENRNWRFIEGMLNSVDVAFDLKVELNKGQPDGMTALHWACFHGHAETVEHLIKFGSGVNANTIYDVSPLSIACEYGHYEVAKLLLNSKTKPDVEGKRLGGERPLMLAARSGKADLVKLLIESKADVNAREVKGQNALMWGAAAGNLEVVKALLNAKADIEYSTKQGFNALMFAARQGKKDATLYLIENGFDVNSVMEPARTGGRNPRKGLSALLLAVENGHFELALELVRNGADPNDQRSGFSPLHAVTWVRRTEVGDNPSGDPAPRTTGSVNSLDFVREMVKLGAKVNLQLENKSKPGKAKLKAKGATAFLYASKNADIPLMNLLLELGADPKLTNADGCNALLATAGVGVVAVGEEPGTEQEVDQAIEMLLELGLDVNSVDQNGETAMHGAAYRNFPSAVKLLAEKGADPAVWNRKNKHNWTPHMIASGKRPGSLKPSPATIAALDQALKQH